MKSKKPTKYHYWDSIKNDWNINLDRIRKKLILDVSNLKNQIRNSDTVIFELNGISYKQKFRKTDTADITSRVVQTQITNMDEVWFFSCGGSLNMNTANYIALSKKLSNAIEDLYEKEFELCKMIMGADEETLINFSIEEEWFKI